MKEASSGRQGPLPGTRERRRKRRCAPSDTTGRVLAGRTEVEPLKICVLFGGRSGEHEVSLRSAASVVKNLDRTRYEVTAIGIDKSGRWHLQQRIEVRELAGQGDLLTLFPASEPLSVVPGTAFTTAGKSSKSTAYFRSFTARSGRTAPCKVCWSRRPAVRGGGSARKRRFHGQGSGQTAVARRRPAGRGFRSHPSGNPAGPMGRGPRSVWAGPSS